MFKSFLAAAAAALFACPAAWAADNLELSFQSVYAPAQTQNVEILVPWAEAFEQKSGGSLIVHFFPVSAIVDINEAGHAIQSGMLDMGVWGGATFPKDTPYGYMINLPFLTRNSRHGTALLNTLYETVPEFKQDTDNMGVPLAMWTSASFGISSVNAPVRSPADIRGKRVLIISASDSVSIEAWGGIPVFVTPSDVYVGLQRGMGEMFYTAIPFQKGLRIMEVAKYITPLPSTANEMVMAINRDLYEDLSDEHKNLLHAETGRALSERIAANLDADVVNCLKLFEEAGAQVINLTPEEMDAFFTGLRATIDSYWVGNLKDVGVKGDAKAWIDKYYQLADSVPDPDAF